MTCLILASGKQERFGCDTPKQLLPVRGKTILGRMLEQTSGITTIVVTANPEIQKHAPVWFVPEDYRTIIHTFRSTAPLWVRRMVVLLGDVIYTPETMQKILNDTRKIGFWLNGSEIYALTFDEDQKERLLNAIKDTVFDMPQGEKSLGFKLWHLYRKLNNADIHVHKVFANELSGDWISDGTCDIDSFQAYKDFLSNH